MEEVKLAEAVVDFQTNFAKVADDISKIAKTSEKTFEAMQKQVEQTEKAIDSMQGSLKDTEKEAGKMSNTIGKAFGTMTSAVGMFSGAVGGGLSIMGKFFSVMQSVASIAVGVFSMSMRTAVSVLQKFIELIGELGKKLTQIMVYIASLPVQIVSSFKAAHKAVGDTLDEWTKKFVFLQLDIRHIMDLMKRFLFVTGGAMAGATAAAAKFEDQFIILHRVTQMSESELYELEKRIRSTSTEIGRSAGELAELAGVAGRLGIEGVENLDRFAEVMGKLSVATNIQGEEAATQFTRLMTVMGESEDRIDNIAAGIVALGNNFAAFEDEILAMSLQLAGAGNAIDMTTADLMGLATAMAAVDVRVERGGSAMSRTMIEVANAVQNGGDALKTFAELSGMTAEEFATVFEEDPLSAIHAFLTGLADMNELPFETLEDLNLAQIRTRDVILRLIGATEQLGETREVSRDAVEEGIAHEEEYQTAMQTTMAQLGKLRDNFMELARRIGDLYNEEVVEMIKAFRSFIQTLLEVEDETWEAIAGFLALVSIVVATVAGFLMLVRTFFTVATAITLLLRGLWWLATAGLAIMLVTENLDKLFSLILGESEMNSLEQLSGLFNQLAESGQRMKASFVDTAVGEVVVDLVEGLKNAYADFIAVLSDIEESDMEPGDRAAEIGISFMEMLDDMVFEISRAVRSLEDIAETYSLGDAFDVFAGDLEEDDPGVRLAKAFGSLFKSALELAVKDIPSLLATVMGDLVFPEIWDLMMEDDGFVEMITDMSDKLAERIRESTKNLNVDEMLGGDDSFTAMGDLGRSMFELGKAMGEFLWTGVMQVFEYSNVGDTLAKQVETVREYVESINWETDDPIDEEIVSDTGFGKLTDELVKLAIAIITSMFEAIRHQVDWVGIGSEIGSGIWNYLKGSMWDKVSVSEEDMQRDKEQAEEVQNAFDQMFIEIFNRIRDSVNRETGAESGNENQFLGLASGAILKGYGGGDQIPALLEAGEAVIPKEAIRQGIPGVIEWLKNMGVPGYQAGFLPEGLSNMDNLGEIIEFGDLTESGMFGNVFSNLENTFEEIKSVEDAVEVMGEGMIFSIDKVLDGIIKFAEKVLRLDEEQVAGLREIKGDVVDFLESILTRFEKSVPEEDRDRDRDADGEEEPEEDKEKARKEMLEGLDIESGILELITPIQDELEKEFESEIKTFKSVFEGFTDSFARMKEEDVLGFDIAESRVGKFFGTLKEMGEDISGAFRDRIDGVGNTFGKLMYSLNPLIGAIMGVVTQSKTWERLMDILSEIFDAVANAIGMFLEPLIPIANVLATVLIPVFEALGQIISSILMPVMRMLFPILKGFGIVVLSVAQAIGKVWNALLDLLGIVIDLNEYKIDVEGLSEATKELKNSTWDSMMERDKEKEAIKDVTESLRNVPQGYAVALKRFQTAAGAFGETRKEEDQKLDSISGWLRDIYYDFPRMFGGEKVEKVKKKDQDTFDKTKDMNALQKIGYGALNPVSTVVDAGKRVFEGVTDFFGFAEGGIVTKPVAGMIGEKHKPEAVIPLERLPELMNNMGGTGTVIIFEGDVYGMEDFEEKVYQATENRKSTHKNSRYGITSNGRR